MHIADEIFKDAATVERLTKGLLGFGHPVRLQCLVWLSAEHSPSELFELFGEQRSDDGATVVREGPTLGTVSYHVRMLRDYGLVVEVRVQPRRGALEHFYVRTELADRIFAAVAPVLGVSTPAPRKTKKAPAAIAA